MCCLYGLLDTKHILSGKQKSKMLSVLATECEARGTDATGIAYNSNGALRIYKRPWPARYMRFRVPTDAQAIMGHTRLTTQGSEKRNYNNHPFEGRTKDGAFALAHNGVLYNDITLRRTLKLPKTKIETDSYIAVQLIEQQKSLRPDSLKYMAETVEGSFTFTVMDEKDNLYFVKEDSPLCLVYFPRSGLYLYASTKEILFRAMQKMKLPAEKMVEIEISSGEILRIDRAGMMSTTCFDDAKLYRAWYRGWEFCPYQSYGTRQDSEYIQELKAVAATFGYTPESIDRMLRMGMYPEEIEEFLYEQEAALCEC